MHRSWGACHAGATPPTGRAALWLGEGLGQAWNSLDSFSVTRLSFHSLSVLRATRQRPMRSSPPMLAEAYARQRSTRPRRNSLVD